jgi:hypothetical protein
MNPTICFLLYILYITQGLLVGIHTVGAGGGGATAIKKVEQSFKLPPVVFL